MSENHERGQRSFCRRRALLGLFGVLGALLVLGPRTASGEDQPIRLVTDPALSPDGKTLAFSWSGDVWTAPVEGGAARRLTQHAARDGEPEFSPDGERIAFTSDRDGGRQVYVVPAVGGEPERLTYHSEGFRLEGWYPDGRHLLVSGVRDHFWRNAERFFRIDSRERRAARLLFDAAGTDGAVAPDGERLLFCREGDRWWRKGYRGSRSAQIWLFEAPGESFRRLLAEDTECRWPLWRPDGKGFYYVGGRSGSWNLWEQSLDTGDSRQLTDFDDDSVVFPAISRDGSTIVFRHLFDLYLWDVRAGGAPRRIDIFRRGDRVAPKVERRMLRDASAVAFTDDGLEVAFVAGGDLWVMDTELREPRQVTSTAEAEGGPVFNRAGDTLYFVSDRGGQTDIWKAERGDASAYWWQNTSFRVEPVTRDGDVESRLEPSPTGKKLAFVKGLGDLWTLDLESGEAKLHLRSWNAPEYDWSPDDRWFVYARSDNDFNRDIWLLPVDGSREPFNLSRHPDNESSPVWSPDGRLLAFTGRRVDEEVDLYYVWLRREDDQRTGRERKLEKALEKFQVRKKKTPQEKPPGDESDRAAGGEKEEKAEAKKPPEPVEVVIDFEDIHERVHRIAVPNSSVRGLFWSHDSKKLAFRAAVDGKSGLYTVEIPENLQPKLLSTRWGSGARWLAAGEQIVWLSGGVPGRLSASGEATAYSFVSRQEVDLSARNVAAFDLVWRTMRDMYYDERLGNRNWDAVRRKYAAMARQAPDGSSFETVVKLMLGELNGSHVGFRARGGTSRESDGWRPVTGHLGLRFDTAHQGPGLRVRDVLPDGPTDAVKSRVLPGEFVLAIDDREVDPDGDLASHLNGPLERDIALRVRSAQGEERRVVVRPITYGAARNFLYEKWISDNRRRVGELSGGRLAYLHVRGMNWPSFLRFEREIYAVGAGKRGLVIDVRENGGGFTADHLLTVLNPAVHAITVPRGGGPGYPQDRRVYATWNRPVLVLCNQNSFSNAEIFSHAIKTLGRGQLVGVPTAGGVISTGGRAILDVGFLRMPFRGWFVLGDGEDMELKGAVPHHVIWPLPGELPAGKDRQLERGVEVLLSDVEKWQARSRPRLRKASERPENLPRRARL